MLQPLLSGVIVLLLMGLWDVNVRVLMGLQASRLLQGCASLSASMPQKRCRQGCSQALGHAQTWRVCGCHTAATTHSCFCCCAMYQTTHPVVQEGLFQVGKFIDRPLVYWHSYLQVLQGVHSCWLLVIVKSPAPMQPCACTATCWAFQL